MLQTLNPKSQTLNSPVSNSGLLLPHCVNPSRATVVTASGGLLRDTVSTSTDAASLLRNSEEPSSEYRDMDLAPGLLSIIMSTLALGLVILPIIRETTRSSPAEGDCSGLLSCDDTTKSASEEHIGFRV